MVGRSIRFFYEGYERLIYSSPDMGILDEVDFEDAILLDKNKAHRIIENLNLLLISFLSYGFKSEEEVKQ